MVNLEWKSQKSQWKGECPRCGIASYFSITTQAVFPDNTRVDVVECPEGHPFSICSNTFSERGEVLYVTPVSGDAEVPTWLPPEYVNAFSEMYFDYKSGKYRSAVSVAGILLDAHISSLLLNPGDKKKTLANRLEILVTRKLIDADQFADGTVARLSRNGVIHPDDVAAEISQENAAEVMDAVGGCLERYYRWRRTKALPAPKDQIGETEEECLTEISVEGETKSE